MKKAFIFVISATLFFLSCTTSTNNVESTPDIKVSTDKTTISTETDKDTVQSVQNDKVTKSEYERSIEDMEGTAVSIDEFQQTKKDILQVIAELNKIIKNKDYESWLGYISPESKEYWTDPVNLANVANCLTLVVDAVKMQ